MLGSQQEAGGSFTLPHPSLVPGLGKDSALQQLWEKTMAHSLHRMVSTWASSVFFAYKLKNLGLILI